MQALNRTIFGIIAVSLAVGIVNVFVFHAIWVRLHPDLNTHSFRYCLNFSGKKVTPPAKCEGARTPMLIALQRS